MEYQPLLSLALQAAEVASKKILEVYHSGNFQAEAKGDNSPVTIADKQAHEVITNILQPSGLPVLSEEGSITSFEQRKGWTHFWMVDPLDGTKEFLKRNGEFTVNIALIQQGIPVLGVVVVPVTGDAFFAASGSGAFLKRDQVTTKLDKRTPIDLKQRGLRVVASRSHMNFETQSFIEALQEPSLISQGSSLKFMLLAENKADIYPRYAPTMEWDTAAAHAIMHEVGLKVYQWGREEELLYNKENLLNPSFLVL
ncbi:MAG TPA: 3'(2'),5'-bisphosphate nucleotidase CysQ [Ohtaekwangia sp.]|uniref:3'(2'),5'-bisphosphate nucleotidase CysQ n=1 Tax=Ohtaekwangia sp. TaxID=2066019 RepID=UPI002F92F9F4